MRASDLHEFQMSPSELMLLDDSCPRGGLGEQASGAGRTRMWRGARMEKEVSCLYGCMHVTQGMCSGKQRTSGGRAG